MAKKDFDFKALQGMNAAKYLKAYCKPVDIKKAAAGIAMLDYKINGKKQAFMFLPFKKLAEAVLVFKQIKESKEHLLKKVGLVSVVPSEKGEIHLETKKGGLSSEMMAAKATDFFMSNFKLKLVATGEAVADDTSADAPSSADAPAPATSNTRLVSYKEIAGQINKLIAAMGTMSPEKIGANIQKFEKALSSLENEAMADGDIDAKEQAHITKLRNGLKKLAKKAPKQEAKAKKLTPERKEKIKKNMAQIQGRLDKMMKSLGI